IAIGRSGTASLSMCLNKKGNIMACIDVPKTSYVADMPDVSILIPTDWNQDGKMDLIIGSKGAGLLRWIASNGDGTFSFDPQTYRTLRLESMASVTIGPVGPGGKDYIMAAGQNRTVTFIPVLPTDRSHIDKCFRSWVLGGAIETLRYGDLNNDGSVELVGIDSDPWGIAVAMATGDGNYRAATVHRICGLNAGTFFFSFLPVSQFVFADVSADGKPDLLLMSDTQTSTISAKAFSCKTEDEPPLAIPRATHYLHLYANEGDRLEEAARAGEWGPYNTPGDQAYSGAKLEDKSTCGSNLPPITAMKLGEFNGSPPLDLVLTREQDYSVGEPPTAETPCPFNERNEVANLFGLENSDANNGPQCVNFRDGDESKKLPLTSSKGGAPLNRSSLLMFINADPVAPFGLKTSNRPDNPVNIRAHFQVAGGKSPTGLVVGRFDGDNIDDVATLMEPYGTPTGTSYLAPRVRIFRGLGGRFKPIVFFKNGTKDGDKIANENPATSKEVVGINELSTWAQLNSTGSVDAIVPVSYHTTGDQTFSMRGERFCKDGETSLFFITKIGQDTKLAVVRAQGNLKFSPVTTYNGGTTLLSAFALVDADGDKCTDAVVVVDGNLAYSRGTTSWYEAWKYFLPIEIGSVPSIELLDVNNDKNKDLLLIDGDSSSLRFFLNDGKGNFVAYDEPIPVLNGATSSELGDIDGDGCGDLAVQGEFGVAMIRSRACEN
ncbi:MAG TPA: hypothetical protein DCQ06_04370, partial [Myxococcales bacterium]|nr:hypothetical protein [Myxococcales bacterium]